MTRLLKAEDVAKIFGMSEYRIYELAREGILPVCRLGRQVRFSQEAINDFIASGGKAFQSGWRKKA